MLDTLPLVLKLDVAGQPIQWITYERSAYYYTKDRVLWEAAPVDFTLHGGTNAKTGKQSTLIMNTIIAVKQMQKTSAKHLQRRATPPLTNKSLFRRDLNICAYCGDHFHVKVLSRDHIVPSSKGGPDVWENVVTACADCNKTKDNKTLQQAHMQLIYVPYVPVMAEWLILQNRKILFDQQQFLLKQVPKESRLYN